MTKKSRSLEEVKKEQEYQEMIKKLFQRDYTPKFPEDNKKKKK